MRAGRPQRGDDDGGCDDEEHDDPHAGEDTPSALRRERAESDPMTSLATIPGKPLDSRCPGGGDPLRSGCRRGREARLDPFRQEGCNDSGEHVTAAGAREPGVSEIRHDRVPTGSRSRSCRHP